MSAYLANAIGTGEFWTGVAALAVLEVVVPLALIGLIVVSRASAHRVAELGTTRRRPRRRHFGIGP